MHGNAVIKRSFVTLIILCLMCCSQCALAAREKKVVRVGWYDTGEVLKPSEYSGAHGYDYEYLQALAQYALWEYEYVAGTWSECLERLAAGEIDILSFVRKNADRESVYGFPNLPMGISSGWIVVSSENNNKSSDVTALNGARIGVVKGNAFNSYMEQYCLDNGLSVEYVVYESLSDISPALAQGAIDAAVVADEDLTDGETRLIRLASENHYFVTNINDKELLKQLNEAMSQLNSYCPYLNNDLYDKYFGFGMEGRPIFTAAEQAFIAEHPEILVMYDSGWPPVEYYDDALKDYAGISPDLFKLMSQKCGIDFVYEGSTSGQVLSRLQGEDNKNVLTTISYDYGWAEKHNVYITQPFISSSIVRLGKNVDAENPTVAINEKAFFTYILADRLKGVNTVNFSKQIERLEAVRTGKADYTFVTEDQANYYRSMPKYAELTVKNEAGFDQEVCISVSKNSDPELLTILSKTLGSISHDEMTAIIIKNTVNNYEKTLGDILYEYRMPLIVIAILALCVIASLVALYALRRASSIKLKTAFEQEKTALAAARKASAAKGSFMSRMSHEIRTPLNAVIGYNTIARNEMSQAKDDVERRQAEMKVMDCLTKSEIASRHLLTIINDVLDMSAIESGKINIARERFDFKGMITSLTTVFYSQAKAKGVRLDVVFDTLTEEWFVGDQMRTNQILTNLLSNAVKFTPDGGRVRLAIRQPEAVDNAAHIRFEVADTGIGMEKAYLEHIWTPFEQADASIARRFGGTGLGLSITKNLVDLMGGTIMVESEPGKGTTFTVDLTFERTKQPQSAASYDFGSVNALVVDDDVSTCDYVQLLFTRCGARCACAYSGEDAIEAFKIAKAGGEQFTMCMVDWRMPKIDGIETIKRIRAIAGNDIPIIVISAYDFTEIADKAAQVGVNMFISKPLFQSSLFNLLANICGKPMDIKPKDAQEYDFSGCRVLLAEDNAMNMEIARKILENGNLDVECAWNGQEALSMFEKSKNGYYAAILMDVQMPVMDGHQAAKAIRALERPDAGEIPIIAMTADAFAENVAEARASGMNDHISKPIDIPTLFQTLEKYAKRG